jgi:excisionase family DNA binding protein
VTLLTVAEVASELRISVRTVLGYIAAGELRAVGGIGRGRGYRVRREWLDAFVRSREVAPAMVARGDNKPGRAERAARDSRKATFTTAREARVALGLLPGGTS